MKRTTVFLLALLLATGCLFTLAGCGQSHFDSKDANLRLFSMRVTEEFDVAQSE